MSKKLPDHAANHLGGEPIPRLRHGCQPLGHDEALATRASMAVRLRSVTLIPKETWLLEKGEYRRGQRLFSDGRTAVWTSVWTRAAYDADAPHTSLKRLVGERGFEPPTPWSRRN
jgi:hypothetical protein